MFGGDAAVDDLVAHLDDDTTAHLGIDLDLESKRCVSRLTSRAATRTDCASVSHSRPDHRQVEASLICDEDARPISPMPQPRGSCQVARPVTPTPCPRAGHREERPWQRHRPGWTVPSSKPRRRLRGGRRRRARRRSIESTACSAASAVSRSLECSQQVGAGRPAAGRRSRRRAGSAEDPPCYRTPLRQRAVRAPASVPDVGEDAAQLR